MWRRRQLKNYSSAVIEGSGVHQGRPAEMLVLVVLEPHRPSGKKGIVGNYGWSVLVQRSGSTTMHTLSSELDTKWFRQLACTEARGTTPSVEA